MLAHKISDIPILQDAPTQLVSSVSEDAEQWEHSLMAAGKAHQRSRMGQRLGCDYYP